MKSHLFLLLNLFIFLTVKSQENNDKYKNPVFLTVKYQENNNKYKNPVFLTVKYQKNNPDIPLMNEWDKIAVYHFHVSDQILSSKDTIIKKGREFGFITGYPEPMSETYDKEIKLSIEYYNKGDYHNAKNILTEAEKKEPNNFFILEHYSRACYKIDKEESYRVYQKLVRSLDSVWYDTNYQFSIDLWHKEAYWKLGTLYMDNKKWKEAYFEISRFLFTITEQKGKSSYCQVLEYLTECAYMFYEDDLALYLANRTLLCDPKNKYVNDLLKKIKITDN